MRALVRQKALEGSDGAEGERNTAEGFRSMNQSRLPAAERGEPCALVSGGKEGCGMHRSKSPDHAVIRSDLNGGQGIFELGSILALSGVSVA